MTKNEDELVGGQTDIAVALSYNGQGAPRVTAKGKHALAEQIMRIAEESNIPLYPDPELAVVLSAVPMGEDIPEQLYVAVAEVISFAYLVAGKFPEGFGPEESPGD